MSKHRRSLDLSDTRAVLATSGDVFVGAYARRVRRQRLGIALVGVLLIGGAGATYWALREPQSRAEAGKYDVAVQCSTCSFSATVSVEARQVFPLVCLACKERTCRQVWQCRKCGGRFVPPDGGIATVCPVQTCRSAEVGTAATP